MINFSTTREYRICRVCGDRILDEYEMSADLCPIHFALEAETDEFDLEAAEKWAKDLDDKIHCQNYIRVLQDSGTVEAATARINQVAETYRMDGREATAYIARLIATQDSNGCLPGCDCPAHFNPDEDEEEAGWQEAEDRLLDRGGKTRVARKEWEEFPG